MDRITALRARQAGLIDSMTALLAAVPEGEDMTAEQAATLASLQADDDKVAAQIAVAQDLERRRAAAATPVAALPGLPPVVPGQPGVPAAVAEKGIRFARSVRALFAAGGSPHIAQQIAESWGDSGLFANQNTQTGGAGGFLVPEDVSSDFIELLRPASVVMAMGPVFMPMPNGNMTINRLASGVMGGYIGEQQNIPATGVGFTQVKLSAKKLGATIPMSSEALRFASIAMDRIVRDDALNWVGQATDAAFIRAAGTQFSPRGLRYQLVGTALETINILTMTATPTLLTVTSDLARMQLVLANQDVPMLRPGWLMAPRTESFLMNIRDSFGNFAFPEMANGRLRGYPYRRTTQIPINLGAGVNETELYLADFAQVVVGETMGVEVAVSTEAAYVDATGTMRAAFSRDETVMRVIVQHDIGIRHLSALSILTGVTWTP